MRVISPLIIAFFVLTGCDGTYDNSPVASQPAFTVSLASTSTPVPVNAQLILHATTALEPSTVNENSVYIKNSSKELVPAYITLIDQDIVVQPKVYLSANTDFDLIVTTAVASSSGAHLNQDSVASFTSGAASDFTAPVIVASLPANGSGMKEFGKIYFQLTEPISPLSINNSTIIVTMDALSMNISGTVNSSGSLVSFTPDQDLNSSIDTTWSVFLDLNTVFDLAGNQATALAGENNISMFPQASAPGFLTPKPLGSDVYDIGAPVNCVESAGNLMFVGSSAGLHLVEFNTITETFTHRSHLVSSSIGFVYSVDIDLATQRAYVGSSTGLSILDISNITEPLVVGSYPTTAPVYGLDLNGTDLYLAASVQGLVALDITIETAPAKKFEQPTNGTAFGVLTYYDGFLARTVITVADYDQGVSRFNTTGTALDFTGTQHQTRQLLWLPTNSEIYTASGIGGVKSLDIVSTLGMSPVASMPSYTTKIILDGDTVYTNDFGTGVGVISSLNRSLDSYIPMNRDITTLSSIRNGVDLYLILADTNGQLLSMKVQ